MAVKTEFGPSLTEKGWKGGGNPQEPRKGAQLESAVLVRDPGRGPEAQGMGSVGWEPHGWTHRSLLLGRTSLGVSVWPLSFEAGCFPGSQTFLTGPPGPEVDGQMGPICVSGQRDPGSWGGCASEQSRGWEKAGATTCQLVTQPAY